MNLHPAHNLRWMLSGHFFKLGPPLHQRGCQLKESRLLICMEPLPQACSLKSTLNMSFQLELELCTGLIMVASDCEELQNLYCGSHAIGFSTIVWLVTNASLLSTIPSSLITHFEHGHFTLLKLLRAWGLVKLSIVWALDESLSTPSILQIQALNSSLV